jgi:hypothetical protein
MASAREQPTANAESARLDFLGAERLTYENKRNPLLVFLGFPWILSSESRLINEVCGIFEERIFSPLSLGATGLGTTAEAIPKRMFDHGESLL